MTSRLERAPMTKPQRRIFHFIDRYIKEHGYPPTLDMIGNAVGLSSKSTVSVHVHALARKGYLEFGEVRHVKPLRVVS